MSSQLCGRHCYDLPDNSQRRIMLSCIGLGLFFDIGAGRAGFPRATPSPLYAISPLSLIEGRR